MRLVIDLQGAQGDNHARGIGRYSRELAHAMAAAPRRHQVHILLNAALPTATLRATFAETLPDRAVHLWHSPGATAWHSAPDPARRRAAEALRAEAVAALRPDLLHVSSLFEGWVDDAITAWPSWCTRPPTVATGYDLIPLIRRADYLDSAWKQAGITPWYLHCLHQLRLADGALAISQSSRDELLRHLALPPDRVWPIMAGIGPEFRPPNLTAQATAAQATTGLNARLGLRDGYVLFLGGGDIRKNEPGLIQAWALLPAALRARHQLVIVRRGDPAPLRHAAHAAGLPETDLHLIDFVADQDLPALYASCALFVLPSLHEGFGLPAAEAMACGVPAIASNTTSLPEVIGRPDALFDPHDPAAIAARIREVLENPALRAALAAHAPVQAARFNWPDVAARAWDALETLHADHAPWTPGWRPRLACVAPLPPQPSGIADYTADLLPDLARHYDITLVADIAHTTAESLAGIFPLIPPARFLEVADSFDRVLYQVGNSPFHATAIEDLLPQAAGVVTLHDTFLSNATSWIAHHRPDGARPDGARTFTEALFRAHGWPAVLHEHRHGHLAALRDYPCSLRVLQDALGVIQHSHHAQGLVAAHYGPALADPIRIIPHLRHPLEAPDRATARRHLGIPEGQLLVCSFGYLAPAKLPDILLAAWHQAALPTSIPAGARLAFVGPTDPNPGPLREAAALATGHVDTETYRAWLVAADIAVQLRRDSRGETSGAMLDAMAAGCALIANAHGAAAELPPDAVHLLPETPTAAQLATALRALADPATRHAQATRARAHIARHHAPRHIAAAYRDAIEAAYAEGPAASRHRATASLARALPPDTEDSLLTDCARALAATFPAAGPPTMLIDATDLPPEATPLIAALLATHPPDLRVDLVEWRGTWHHARTRAVALLGLPTPPAPDTQADPAGTTLLVPLRPDGTCPLPPARLPPTTRIVLLATTPHLKPEPWMPGRITHICGPVPAHILPTIPRLPPDAATLLAALFTPRTAMRRAAE